MRVTQMLVVLSSVAACGTTDDGEPPAGRISKNAIAFSDVTAHQVAITELGSKKFSLNNAATQSMLGTEGSREVLEYLISCALPKGQSFNVSTGGATFTFHGDIGLAKSWKQVKLTEKQQRWISACMLARINNQGQLMNISLRGPHHALHVTPTEVSRFSLEEGVYYGNIFTGQLPVVGWSCRGKDQALGEGGEGSAMSFRDCAEPGGIRDGGDVVESGNNQCGWGYAEDCFIHALNIPFACESRVTTGGGIPDPEADGDASDQPAHGSNAPNTYYRRCHAGGVIPLLEPMWNEVVTVYVENGPPILD